MHRAIAQVVISAAIASSIMLGTAGRSPSTASAPALSPNTSLAQVPPSRDWFMFILGVLAGGGASWIVGKIIEWQQEKRERAAQADAFRPIAGFYRGYPLDGLQKVDYARQLSSAEVKYEGANVLTLVLREKEQDSVWEGTIYMAGRKFGTVTWQYVRRDGHEPPVGHHFGFKRCMVAKAIAQDQRERLHLYLIGDDAGGYGTEVLERCD